MNLEQTFKFAKADQLVTMEKSVTITNLLVGDVNIRQIAEGFYEAECQGFSQTGITASVAAYKIYDYRVNQINIERENY